MTGAADGNPGGIDPAEIVAARRVLHLVAESLLAGPQYRATDEIRLTVTPDGFRTWAPMPGPVTALRVDAAGVTAEPSGVRTPISAGLAATAAELGVTAGPPEDLYPDHADLPPDAVLAAREAALAAVLAALATGTEALRLAFPGSDPILWPEHFDVGITVDEVNYGVSPGDAGHDLPYAYVGPWRARRGDFWNEPFGASRPLADLGDAAAVADFFRAGRDRAATDPL